MNRFSEIYAILRVATRLLWLGHALNLLGVCVIAYAWLELPLERRLTGVAFGAGFFVCAILTYELSKRRAGAAAALLVQQELAEYRRASGRIDAEH